MEGDALTLPLTQALMPRRAQHERAVMSEKRQPIAKVIAVIPGKRRRITMELFLAGEFPQKRPKRPDGRENYFGSTRYRIRINGKWHGGRKLELWTLTEFCDAIRSDLHKTMFPKSKSDGKDQE